MSAEGAGTAKYARRLLIFLLTIFFFNRFEWPFAIRCTDWRLNDVCGAVVLVALSIAIIWFGATLRRPRLAFIVVLLGIMFLIPIALGFPTVDLPNLLSTKDREFHLLDSVAVGPDQYRLYSYEYGGFGSISYALLRRERDTPFGVKFVKTVWVSAYDCCFLQLQTTRESRIDVLNKADGKVVEVIKR
ncbi:hypothetical protein SBC2_83110 (plasmid) [Caballeronia sp. SBC2]|nr:hypothetical protein SBC2_83110 [Caballeronia sp. SBC2]